MLLASWTVVRRAGLLAPVAVVVVLLAGTAHLLDDGYGMQVLRGVGVLLACAWVTTMDDPMGEVAAGSPYPRSVRTVTRAGVGMAIVFSVWVVCAVLVEARAETVPVLRLGLAALALGFAGLAMAAVVRFWAGHHQPSYVAVASLVVFVVALDALPRGWEMLPPQSWGPPWEAAQIRWSALLLFGVGVLALALRDPLAGLKTGPAHAPALVPGIVDNDLGAGGKGTFRTRPVPAGSRKSRL